MNKLELVGWLATLPDDAPELGQVADVRAGRTERPDEPLLSLRELASALGFKSYTSLHRLGIQCVGVGYGGGRLRYRKSAAEAYLRSPECVALRARLWTERRAREGRRGDAGKDGAA